MASEEINHAESIGARRVENVKILVWEQAFAQIGHN
jgi:hypothetical protein